MKAQQDRPGQYPPLTSEFHGNMVFCSGAVNYLLPDMSDRRWFVIGPDCNPDNAPCSPEGAP